MQTSIMPILRILQSIPDKINLREFKSLSKNEKYERLKESYKTFAVGEEIGGFETYEVSESSENAEGTVTSYSEILDMFYQNISTGWKNYSGTGWAGINGTDPKEVSFEWYDSGWSFEEADDLTHTGYQFIDINQDGTMELVVGYISSYDGSAHLCDLYTIYDNQVVHLAGSMTRESFFIGTHQDICGDGSGGAALHGTTYYHIEQGKLKAFEEYKYDGYEDEKNPYFYSNDPVLTKYENGDYHSEYYEFRNWKQITEEEYYNDGHTMLKLDLTLFSEYDPDGMETVQNTSNADWKTAYLEYLENEANYKHKSGQFALINFSDESR